MVKIGSEEIRVRCGFCKEDLDYIGNLSMDDTDVITMGCSTKGCKCLIYISRDKC